MWRFMGHYVGWLGVSGDAWCIMFWGKYFGWVEVGGKIFWVSRGAWRCVGVSGGGLGWLQYLIMPLKNRSFERIGTQLNRLYFLVICVVILFQSYFLLKLIQMEIFWKQLVPLWNFLYFGKKKSNFNNKKYRFSMNIYSLRWIKHFQINVKSFKYNSRI